MESQRHRPDALLDVTIRSLQESELDTAHRIFRVAFGTFIRLPNPETFAGDADALRTRWKANPKRGFAPAVEGELVGTNVANTSASMRLFCQPAIRPDLSHH